LLIAELHLDQNILCLPGQRRGLLQRSREFDAIDTLNEIEAAHGLTGLVGLEVSNQVPSASRSAFGAPGQFLLLRLSFLDVVLAESIRPRAVSSNDGFYWLTLAYGKDRYAIRCPAAVGGNAGDTVAYRQKIGRNFFCRDNGPLYHSGPGEHKQENTGVLPD